MKEARQKQLKETIRPIIMIVDDDPDITLTFKSALAREFIVDVFNDSSLSLSKFKAGIYDLVLIDIKMPGMNGFELYNELEMIEKDLKVCFMTSFVSYYEALTDIYPELKVRCFIKKPIESDMLMQKIKKELGQSH